MRLLESGGTPSMAEIADAAQVSRRTVYMYFPTLEQLMIDATLGALSHSAIDPVIAESGSKDPVERAEKLSRAVNHQHFQRVNYVQLVARGLGREMPLKNGSVRENTDLPIAFRKIQMQ